MKDERTWWGFHKSLEGKIFGRMALNTLNELQIDFDESEGDFENTDMIVEQLCSVRLNFTSFEGLT